LKIQKTSERQQLSLKERAPLAFAQFAYFAQVEKKEGLFSAKMLHIDVWSAQSHEQDAGRGAHVQ
jgi:hypothetical protein